MKYHRVPTLVGGALLALTAFCSTAIVGAIANGSATFRASPASFALAGGTYEICVTDAGNTALYNLKN